MKAVNVSDSGETPNRGDPAANVTLYCLVALKLRLSVTCTVKV